MKFFLFVLILFIDIYICRNVINLIRLKEKIRFMKQDDLKKQVDMKLIDVKKIEQECLELKLTPEQCMVSKLKNCALSESDICKETRKISCSHHQSSEACQLSFQQINAIKQNHQEQLRKVKEYIRQNQKKCAFSNSPECNQSRIKETELIQEYQIPLPIQFDDGQIIGQAPPSNQYNRKSRNKKRHHHHHRNSFMIKKSHRRVQL